MPIPDFQSLMLPLMSLISDGKEHAVRDATLTIGQQFNLSESEWAEKLPSGRAPLFYNRLAWAKTHLKRAGLIDQPRRGVILISERGRQALLTQPNRIDLRFLEQFPQFTQPILTASSVVLDSTASVVNASPEEVLERAHAEISQELADELIETIKQCSPEFFERLVVKLLLNMGYGGSQIEAGKAVGRSGDGGIDGVINEDRLGLDAIYIQAKRWEGAVGEGPIRDFKGALDAKGAIKGVFITTSTYTPAAVAAAKNSRSYRIVLIDGVRLAQLMIEHGLGVSITATYQLKKIDSDFFADE
jgi:restriction system protein